MWILNYHGAVEVVDCAQVKTLLERNDRLLMMAHAGFGTQRASQAIVANRWPKVGRLVQFLRRAVAGQITQIDQRIVAFRQHRGAQLRGEGVLRAFAQALRLHLMRYSRQLGDAAKVRMQQQDVLPVELPAALDEAQIKFDQAPKRGAQLLQRRSLAQVAEGAVEVLLALGVRVPQAGLALVTLHEVGEDACLARGAVLVIGLQQAGDGLLGLLQQVVDMVFGGSLAREQVLHASAAVTVAGIGAGGCVAAERDRSVQLGG